MAKDNYFLKVYQTDPDKLDKYGHITESTPLLPLFGYNPKAVDFLGKPVNYEERDDMMTPVNYKQIPNQKLFMYDDNLDKQFLTMRKPNKRGASVFSYAFPENAVNHSSGLNSDIQEITLSKPNSRLGLIKTDADAQKDLLSRIMTYSIASAARNGPEIFRKFWKNSDKKLAPVVTIVQAADTDAITDDEIINNDYDAWKDFNEEFQLKNYTPIAQLPYEDFLSTKDLDKGELVKLLYKAFPENLRGKLYDIGPKTFEYPVGKIFEEKLGFDPELAKMLGKDVAFNVTDGTYDLSFDDAVNEAVEFLPDRFNIFDKDKFVNNFKYDKGLTLSDECMKNIKKDMASSIIGARRQSNILRGIADGR